tara:strand:+ start:1051 stop:2376 length:1326 start_codon:yes stop_codon:yes gene_type:complete
MYRYYHVLLPVFLPVFFCLSLIILFLLYNYNTRYNKSSVNLKEAINKYEGKHNEIKPEAIDSLKGFIKSYKHGNEDGLLHILQIYLYGLHPEYGPDKLNGLKLINRIMADSYFSDKIKKVCKMFNEDVSVMVYDDVDANNNNYKQLPSNINDILDDIIEFHIKNKIKIEKSTMNVSVKNTKPEQIEIEPELLELDETTILPYMNNQNRVVLNDSQNVHNHSVQNISKNIINIIDNESNKIYSKSFDENSLLFLNELKKYDDITHTERNNILQVLNSMSDNIHSKYQKSEKDIFNMSFDRIMSKTNPEEKKNLIIMFAQNIASAVEYDIVVCSTGKITRMLSSFDVIDTELPDLKPDWIIKEEIANKSSKIREDILKTSTKKEVEAYMNYDDTCDEKKALHEVVVDKMKSRLIDDCTKHYVETKNLTQSGLDVILTDYLEAF